jgi:hypothetical protein
MRVVSIVIRQGEKLVIKRLLLLAVVLVFAACQSTPPTATPIPTTTPTLVPSRTPFAIPSPQPSATNIPTTPSPTAIMIDSYTGVGSEPPFTITLPEGWRVHYDTALLPEPTGELVPIPLAVFTGPVTGGTGIIAVLWNFPSMTTANPFDEAYGVINLWVDGLRYLRLLVVEIGCNVGTDLETDFTIGSHAATGTYWQAVDCPELPNTRGWFAGLQVESLGVLFYMFTDPLEAMDGEADVELQTILDSVQFQVVTVTPTP